MYILLHTSSVKYIGINQITKSSFQHIRIVSTNRHKYQPYEILSREKYSRENKLNNLL